MTRGNEDDAGVKEALKVVAVKFKSGAKVSEVGGAGRLRRVGPIRLFGRLLEILSLSSPKKAGLGFRLRIEWTVGTREIRTLWPRRWP